MGGMQGLDVVDPGHPAPAKPLELNPAAAVGE